MKKFLSLFLTVLMIFVLSACSSSESQEKSDDQEDTSGSSQIETEESEEVQESETEELDDIELPLEEMVFVDDETCLVKISGSAYISDQYITIPVEWENRSEDVDYLISVSSIYVNSLMTNGYLSTTTVLSPGEGRTDYCILPLENLEANGVTEYTDIALTLTVFDNIEFSDICEASAHIYPYGEEEATVFTRETQPTDQVLVENEDFALIIIGNGAIGDNGEYSIPVYLVNKTDYKMRFSTMDSMVNDVSCNPGNFPDLEAHTSAFATIYLSESEMDRYGITSVESITLRFRVLEFVNSDFSADTIYDEMLSVEP